ncbi:MAG TPA: GNAT family N-acetyltransferase [Longimicrobium sp.]|nr:GNAT family N-acetyltransferase [Longimicrobium sp.]
MTEPGRQITVDIDPVTLDDEAALEELMREFYAHEGLDYERARSREAVRTLLADPALGRIWLFRVGDDVVGYTAVTVCYSLEFAGRYALLDELYVREGWRGRGIGARALERVADACRELGVAAVRLEVDTWNDRAMALYRRLGFELQERYMMSRWIS